MNRYFDLLPKIAEDYGIMKGDVEAGYDYRARIIYSFLGRSGIASLWDVQEDGDSGTVSVGHFKQRVLNLMSSLILIYPAMNKVFSDKFSVCNEIYDTLLKAGCMYHRKYRVCAPLYAVSRSGGCIYIRGHALSEKFSVSGLGSYRLADKADSGKHFRTVHEMFGLRENSLMNLWKQLMKNIRWQKFTSPNNAEYMNMDLRYPKYWVNIQPHEGVICVARVWNAGYKYFLCRKVCRKDGGNILWQALPEWIDPRAVMSACLYAAGGLPPIKYHVDGEIVRMTLRDILPEGEKNLVRLYSWPGRDSQYTRIMNTDVFGSIRLVLSRTGFDFQEV